MFAQLLLPLLLLLRASGSFVSYPYNNESIFVADQRGTFVLNGTWYASLASLRNLDSASSRLYRLPTNNTLRQLDAVQYSQFKEGIFFPSSGGILSDRPPARIMATKEAAACLRGRKIRITGDLQMVLLYIGLADILLGVPNAFEMRSKETVMQTLDKYEAKLRTAGQKKNLDVRYIHKECMDKEIACYSARLLDDDLSDALIVGFGRNAQQLQGGAESFEAYAQHIRRLLLGRRNVLLALTDPFSLHAKKREKENGAIIRLNGIAKGVARQGGRPWLDYFSVTKQCSW